jgi:hypothetical protein
MDPTSARDPDNVIELLDLVQPQPLTAAGNGSSGVTTSAAGSTRAPASLVGKKYSPESSVKNSSAV